MITQELEISAEERAYLLKRGYEDPVWFGMFFFPHWIPVEMDASQVPWLHKGILAILTRRVNFLLNYREDLPKIISNFIYLDENGDEQPIFTLEDDGTLTMVVNKFFGLMIPRGFAKTTLINIATAWVTLYEEHKTLVYLSESSTHSTTQLNNVKSELTVNSRIRAVFGEIKPDRNESLKWTDDFSQCKNGVNLMAKGRGSQVRGINVGGSRPDYIVLDDVEDSESVKTDEQRAKAKEWMFRDVMPALPRHDASATIIAIGTLLHDDALLQTLKKDPRFFFVQFGALDRQGDPLWPQVMDHKKLEQERQAYAKAGQLNSFMMEYMSTIRDEETAKFKASYIMKGPVNDELVGISMACDPAISEKKGADFFALACTGMTKRGHIWVLDTWGRVGVTPREQVDRFFAMYQRWNPDRAGVEAIAYQRALVFLIREEMFRRKCYFEIEEIKHGNIAKTERVEGVLQPRYAAGYITHARTFPELEAQLLDWPNGKKDFPDVVAMSITLLDRYAAAAADPNLDLGDDEYEPLKYDGWAP